MRRLRAVLATVATIVGVPAALASFAWLVFTFFDWLKGWNPGLFEAFRSAWCVAAVAWIVAYFIWLFREFYRHYYDRLGD